MSTWWIHRLVQDGQIIELVSWIFWVIFSICLHELGHGWAALRQGDDTPRRLGHMTLNPLVHMGWPSLLVFALCGIAWGLMPVDPNRFRNRRWGRLIVAAAGPAVNLVIAIACGAILVGWLRFASPGMGGYREVTVFLFSGCSLNLMLLGLNLLPIPPLDGSRILASLSYRIGRLYAHPNAPTVGLFAFVAIFFMVPIGSFYLELFRALGYLGVEVTGAAIGNPPLYDILYPA
jgi:Zn-dependent protease